MSKRLLATIITCYLSFAYATAQEYLYEIGGMAGGAFYMGDANRNAAFRNMNPAAGALFRYNANFRIAFAADIAWARVSGSTEGQDNVFPDNASANFERNVFELGGQAEFNFFPYSDKFKYLHTKPISPYIAGGLGLAVSPGGSETLISPFLSLGTGVKFKIRNRFNIGAELTARKLFGDGLDTSTGNNLLDNPYKTESSPWKNNDWYVMLTLSLTFDFGLRDCKCDKSELNRKN